MGLLARLSRIVPLIIVLAIIAVVVYLVVSYARSSARAKEILISMFTVLCSAISIVFALISLYALADGNSPVLELAASFMVVGLIGLGITFLCKYFFRKHNPHYKSKRQRAHVKHRWPWDIGGKNRQR